MSIYGDQKRKTIHNVFVHSYRPIFLESCARKTKWTFLEYTTDNNNTQM